MQESCEGTGTWKGISDVAGLMYYSTTASLLISLIVLSRLGVLRTVR